jgi:hypothetical protein
MVMGGPLSTMPRKNLASSARRLAAKKDPANSGAARILETNGFIPARPSRNDDDWECADLSALSAGDLSPSNGAVVPFRRAAERGPALPASRPSG